MKYQSQIHAGLEPLQLSALWASLYIATQDFTAVPNWIMDDSNDSKELCHLLYGQPDWFFSADELLCCTVLYVIFMTTAFAAVFTTTAWPPATGAYAIHDIIPVSLMVVFASVLYSDLSMFALLSSCSYFV